MHREHFDTVVIGGGQAGLTAGYYLAQQDGSFVILDANERVGDAWRKRWDSLTLFTPARFSALGRTRRRTRWATTWSATRRRSTFRCAPV